MALFTPKSLAADSLEEAVKRVAVDQPAAPAVRGLVHHPGLRIVSIIIIKLISLCKCPNLR
jgi:hypothetical protein